MRGVAKRGNKQVYPNFIIESEVEMMKEFPKRSIYELVNPIKLSDDTSKYREYHISDW